VKKDAAMLKKIKTFIRDERGNAVIDWVVLLAGVVVLALTVVVTVTSNVDSITSDTSDRMTSIEVVPAG